MKSKICPVCGVSFLPISRKDEYCGRTCYLITRRSKKKMEDNHADR